MIKDQNTNGVCQYKCMIQFNNGHNACMVVPYPETPPELILSELGLEIPQAALLVVGGARGIPSDVDSRLRTLYKEGIAGAAHDQRALIIDGGTDAGIMGMMGEGVASLEYRVNLLGIAPLGKALYPGCQISAETIHCAPLDDNHTHFVLVENPDWGGETDTMFALTDMLSRHVPVVTVLANGGPIAKDEVLRSVRAGWPVVVIQGSGRLADDIARGWLDKGLSFSDYEMLEIIYKGNINLFPVHGTIGNLRNLLNNLINLCKAV